MKHLPTVFAPTVFALLGLVLTGACGGSSSPRPGGIEVSWAIGGSTCTESNIATVRISLLTLNGVYDTESVPCQSKQPYSIRNVDPGNYRIQIDGFPSGSEYASFAGSTPEVIGVVPNGVTKVPRIELSEKPGAVDLTWKFFDGSLCGFAGVDTVAVYIWDIHSKKVFSGTFPCDPVMAKTAAEQQDPAVQLYPNTRGVVIDQLYAGTYKLRAYGVSESDLDYKYWSEASVNVDFGRVTPVDVVLQSCKATDAQICNL